MINPVVSLAMWSAHSLGNKKTFLRPTKQRNPKLIGVFVWQFLVGSESARAIRRNRFMDSKAGKGRSTEAWQLEFRMSERAVGSVPGVQSRHSVFLPRRVNGYVAEAVSAAHVGSSRPILFPFDCHIPFYLLSTKQAHVPISSSYCFLPPGTLEHTCCICREPPEEKRTKTTLWVFGFQADRQCATGTW